MSQQPSKHGVRLNADVWAHAASFLSDTSSLCALEVASRTHFKIAQKSTAAWRAALGAASSPSLAAAFVKAAPQAGARDLCRAWCQRWRAGPGTAPQPNDTMDEYPTLSLPFMHPSWEGDWRAGEAPRVVFDVGGEAGVMEWNGLRADGTRDGGDEDSLVFVVPPEARRTYEGRRIFSDLTTSCYVIGQDGQVMIECWRHVSYKHEFGYAFSVEYPVAVYHGVLELACSLQNPTRLLNELRAREFDGLAASPPPGADLMTLFTYVRFEQVDGEDGDVEDGEFHILDAQVSFNVSEYDTVFTFEDLARLLLTALDCHPAKNRNAQAAFSRGRLF